MAAMLNKINFMHLCYSLTPILQGILSITSIKVAVSSFPIKGVGWTKIEGG